MALILLQSYTLFNASMILMIANHLFINNYIISLLNIILGPISLVLMMLVHGSNKCVSDALAN